MDSSVLVNFSFKPLACYKEEKVRKYSMDNLLDTAINL